MTAEESATSQTTETPDKPVTPTAEVDVRNLQDKFHNLLDQRNAQNDLSREARDGRNLLNTQRAEKSKELQEQKSARDRCNDKMREHKEVRNGYQDQAKALIAQKKGTKGNVERSLPLQVRKLRTEIEQLLEKQETTVLDPTKEKDLVDSVRRKKKELKELEGKLEGQKLAEVDLSDTDKAIDSLFAKADDEHKLVQEWHTKANDHHEKFVAAVKEIRIISDEADTKHKLFIAHKEKADEYHNKAMELREQVMAVRGERRAEFQARRTEVRNLNDGVNKRLNDPKAIEKANESALDTLKSGGKISLGF